MNVEALNPVLHGALWLSSWIAALYFLRFWRSSNDRLFIFFASAFCLLGLNWLGLELLTVAAERRHELYVLRLLAFGLIAWGIIDKNRRVAAGGTR